MRSLALTSGHGAQPSCSRQNDEPGVAGMTADADIRVLLPEDGVIRVESARLFSDPDSPLCRRFVERACLTKEIEGVAIAPGPTPAIEAAV
jgi:hypothetical protein